MVEYEKVNKLVLSALREDEFLVDCKVSKSNQIMVYVDGFNNFSVDDCRRINHVIESGLNRDIADFELTVSTPGLDKPFKVKEQYIKHTGKQVDIILPTGEKFMAVLNKADDEGVLISYKKNKKEIRESLKYDEISKTKPHINI